MRKQHCLMVLNLALASFARAQETEPIPAASQQQVVEVSGMKDPQLKPYKQMLKGVDAFDEYHRLAPQAAMLFELRGTNGSTVATEGMALKISGEHVSIPLPLGQDGTFSIPRNQEALDDAADMVLNRKKN